MRILLLADIHANWPALRTVAEEPCDLCIVVGDLVDYGVEPVPCVEWVRENAHYVVRGNHDHGLAQNVPVKGKGGYRYLTSITRPLGREQLDREQIHYLARMPVTRQLTLGETHFLLVHATPRDPLDEYAPPDVQFWERRLQYIDAEVICVGHTHHQYVLQVGDKLVINPGSVGQPRDGDPRAAYAVIEGEHVELKRVEYPVEETIQAIQSSRLSDLAKQHLTEVYEKGGVTRS